MNFKRYFVSGLLAIVPLGITWWLLSFLFAQLVSFGRPLVHFVARHIDEVLPALGKLLLQPWVNNLLAALLVLVAIYLLGWGANRVVGRQLFAALDQLAERLPLVKSIYGSVKRLVDVLQTKPGDLRRVVLIDFPHREMKTVGFVTRTMADAQSGRQLAVVYVPTTPNPTSGYLEVVPVESLVSTDWSMEEAMNFIISGGAIAPERISIEGDSTPGG